MATTMATDPRAWRADTIDAPNAWYCPLSHATLSALDRAVQAWRGAAGPVTDLVPSEAVRTSCAADLQPALAALETGRGFVILDRISLEHYTVPEAQALYWLIGRMLGRPFEQNVQGALLYDVRDTGQDVAYGARFSITNAESTFHTDNSFGDELFDYVGLLCMRAAKAGGVNQVVSGYTVYEELRSRHPDVLDTLSRPFHIDRRGGVREGQAATVRYPVLDRQGPDLTIRYLRYWIEVGHQKAGAPLTPDQRHALDVLDSVLHRQDLWAEFTLRPGEMFFSNNRWIFHNRTAFEDYPEVERRRHYVRLWLSANR